MNDLIDHASTFVGPLWPLESAIAANPLVDLTDTPFEVAATELHRRLGARVWPTDSHLRQVGLSEFPALSSPKRPPTMSERAFSPTDARQVVGRLLLYVTQSSTHPSNATVMERVGVVLGDRRYELPIKKDLRRRIIAWLDDPVSHLSQRWTHEEVVDESARHFARLYGWASWAKWNDCWANYSHPSAISRQEFLTLSLAVDLAVTPNPTPPHETQSDVDHVSGLERLKSLEAHLLADVVGRLNITPEPAPRDPKFMIVSCIDVRSEPLRRILEKDERVNTYGYAGFFGLPARVASVDSVTYDSLPVIASPSVTITDTRAPSPTASVAQDLRTAFSTATHEPLTMFALAELSGFVGLPWALLRTARKTPIARVNHNYDSDADANLAYQVLKSMSLGNTLASEVLFVSHASTSTANTHAASLQCGACAAHSGTPNAVALARLCNDPGVKEELLSLGIDARNTNFVAVEHDTTTSRLRACSPCSSEVASLLDHAQTQLAEYHHPGLGARTSLRRAQARSLDWAATRPEWALAGHRAFVVAPRSSLRGVDVGTTCFYHSYAAASDPDASVLASIVSGPLVVAQWINAAYYFSSTDPEVCGASDKTTLSPVGNFAVVSNTDCDLRVGLSTQSLDDADHHVHLPVRLLVAIEAPNALVKTALASSPDATNLVRGHWVHLVTRDSPDQAWKSWGPEDMDK